MSDVMHLLRTMSQLQAELGQPQDVAFAGAADIWEQTQAYHLELDLPGVPAQALELVVDGRLLTLRAERSRPEREGLRQGGRAHGRIERCFELPAGVDTSGIDAELSDGVLHLTIPKRAEAQPRTIAVRSGASPTAVLEATAEPSEKAA